jgi:hypothetical protein
MPIFSCLYCLHDAVLRAVRRALVLPLTVRTLAFFSRQAHRLTAEHVSFTAIRYVYIIHTCLLSLTDSGFAYSLLSKLTSKPDPDASACNASPSAVECCTIC